MTGSGPFSTLLSATAVTPPLQPGPGTAEAATVVVSRTFSPSVLNVVRGTLKVGIVPSVAEPFAVRIAVLLAFTTSHVYVTAVPAPPGRSFAPATRTEEVKTAFGSAIEAVLGS